MTQNVLKKNQPNQANNYRAMEMQFSVVKTRVLMHHRRHPLASEHWDRHPLSLFAFSTLLAVTEIAMKTQPFPEES